MDPKILQDESWGPPVNHGKPWKTTGKLGVPQFMNLPGVSKLIKIVESLEPNCQFGGFL
jgi:hypothetical protein